jgi:hypothetical protein
VFIGLSTGDPLKSHHYSKEISFKISTKILKLLSRLKEKGIVSERRNVRVNISRVNNDA